MHRWVAILFVLCGSAACSHASVSAPFDPQLEQSRERSLGHALALLDEAHQLSSTLAVDQRAWIIADASEIVAPINAARGKQWSLEVWDLARQMERGQERVAFQKNALRELAVNDPGLALRLYRHLDLPASWDAVHNSTEDARALGYSNTFFKPVWENGGARYLSKLQSLACFLGSTGQYPYASMSKIALDVSKSDHRRAERILSDALHYFQRDPGFVSTNSEFVRFILATRIIAGPKLLAEELGIAATALQQSPRAFKNQTRRITAATPLGSANFESQNEALLFRLLPFLKETLPQKASALMSRYESLRKAPSITTDTPVTLAGSVSLTGTADPARMQSRLDESRAYQVQSLAESDPNEAWSVARQIIDSYVRAVALANLAPAFSRVDAKEANAWLSDAQSRFAAISDEQKKIRLMATVARAQILLGRTNDAALLIPQTFDAGEAMFAKYANDHPDEPAYSLPGYDELTDLTTVAVKADITGTVGRVKQVKSDVLRAALLVASAKGMLED